MTEADAPSGLAWTWNGERYGFDLRPHEDGCVLVFRHVFDHRALAAQTATGWETYVAQDWRCHFGDAYEPLREAKRRHDPAAILTPGYDLS